MALLHMPNLHNLSSLKLLAFMMIILYVRLLMHTHTHNYPLQLIHHMPMDDVVILDVDESTIESPHPCG